MLEEILEDALLLRRQIEDGLVCAALAWLSKCMSVSMNRDILNSPLCERSAMAVWAQETLPVDIRLLPTCMRLKLPALACNGAGKLWAAGHGNSAGLAMGG